MNCCLFSGYLLNKPELRTSASGNPVCDVRMSIPRDYKTADGRRESDFITVVAWGRLAETFSSSCDKGTRLNIQTRVRTGLYTDKNGVKRESHKYELDKFEFVEKKSSGTAQHISEESGQESDLVRTDAPVEIPGGTYAPHFEDLGENEELPF